MVDSALLEQALINSLPAEHHWSARALAPVLAARLNNTISDHEFRQQVRALPGGEQTEHALVSFANAQTGDIQIGGIAGRDIINLAAAIILPPVRVPTQFYGDVALPSFYVERSGLLAEARQRLLADRPLNTAGPRSVWRPLALHGMGGIGKSVLARALCDDSAVRAAFPDGVFWVSLGKAPDLIRPLRYMVEQLGGVISDTVSSVQSLKAQLAGLLEQKSCLIVGDDLWSKRDAEALRIGGSACRLLLTTRDAALAEELGATVYKLQGMEHGPARALLRGWAGGTLDAVPIEQLDPIIDRLGALPLALKLAGPQLRHRSPQRWLAEFDVRALKARRPEEAHDSLQQTFWLSIAELSDEERRLYFALAIFRPGEATAEAVVTRLWSGLAGMDAGATAALLADLADRALLDRAPTEPSPGAIRLHDLLHDMLGIELGRQGQLTGHRRLLQAYRPAEGRWSGVPDDGYLYDHLAYHLHAAGAGPELAALFDDQAWLTARVGQRAGTYDGVAEDLRAAILSVTEDTFTQIAAGEPLTAFVALFHLLLVRASLRTRASNQAATLVARAVATGHWSPLQALSVTRQASSAMQRVEIAAALLGLGEIVAPIRPALQQLALASFATLRDAEVRAYLISAIAQQIDGPARDRLVSEALEIAVGTLSALSRSELMCKLLGWLPEPLRRIVADELWRTLPILEPRDRARVMELALPLLPVELLPSAESIIATLPEALMRGRLWRAVARASSGDTQLTAWLYAYGEALRVSDAEDQATLFQALAPSLAKPLQAMARAKALQSIPAIEDSFKRAQLLQAIAAQVPEPERSALFEQALELGGAACVVVQPADLIGSIIPQLPPEQARAIVQEALEFIKEIENPRRRHIGIRLAAPLLDQAQQLEALANIEQDPAHMQHETIEAIAPYLERSAVGRALNLAAEFPYSEVCALLLIELGPQLPEVALPRAVRAADRLARSVRSRSGRAMLWQQIAAIVPVEARGPFLLDALYEYLLDDEQWRAYPRALEVAGKLTGVQLVEARDFLMESNVLPRAPELWRQLAVGLPKDERNAELERLLAALEAVSDAELRAKVLVALAGDVELERRLVVVPMALAAALQIETPIVRAITLLPLLPLADETGRERIVDESLQVLVSEYTHSNTYHLVATLLEHQALVDPARVVRVIMTIGSPLGRATHLLRAIRALPEPARSRWAQELLRTLGEVASPRRQVGLLEDLWPDLPVALRPQAHAIVLELVKALQTTREGRSTSLPLFALLPAAERAPLLEAVLSAYEREEDAPTDFELIRLSVSIGPEHGARMLALARRVGNGAERVKAMAALAAVLPEALATAILAEALEEVARIEDEEQRGGALMEVAPQLAGPLVATALAIAEGCSHHAIKIALISALAKPPVLAGLPYGELARRTVQVLVGDGTLVQHEFLQIVRAAELPKTLQLPPALTRQLVASVIATCLEWEWL